MFDLSLLKAVLTAEQRAFGLSICDDEDFLVLFFKDKFVARFSSHGATVEAIRKEADRIMNSAKSGVEFVRGD